MMKKNGFTLIEILVVFSFIGILTTLGVASYSSYNGTQSVQSATNDVVTLLQSAKSRSISQVIPNDNRCVVNSLSGYEVDVSPGGTPFSLYAVCGPAKVPISTAQLPYQVSFSGPTSKVFFNVASGTITTPVTIIVTGFNKKNTINVSQIGNITIQRS